MCRTLTTIATVAWSPLKIRVQRPLVVKVDEILQFWANQGYLVCRQVRHRTFAYDHRTTLSCDRAVKANKTTNMPTRERRTREEMGRKLSTAQRARLRPILLAKLDDASKQIPYKAIGNLKLFRDFRGGKQLVHLINTELKDLRRQREVEERLQARQIEKRIEESAQAAQSALVKKAVVLEQKLEAQQIVSQVAVASAQEAKAHAESLQTEVKAFRAGPDLESEMRELMYDYGNFSRSATMAAVTSEVAKAFATAFQRNYGYPCQRLVTDADDLLKYWWSKRNELAHQSVHNVNLLEYEEDSRMISGLLRDVRAVLLHKEKNVDFNVMPFDFVNRLERMRR